jgi:hypothetical protein
MQPTPKSGYDQHNEQREYGRQVTEPELMREAIIIEAAAKIMETPQYAALVQEAELERQIQGLEHAQPAGELEVEPRDALPGQPLADVISLNDRSATPIAPDEQQLRIEAAQEAIRKAA